MGHEPTLITSVRRALRLLEAVGEYERGAPAKQLARHTGMPLPTTYHLLRTLLHEGYVTKLDDGGYVLGVGVGALHSQSQDQSVLSRVRPHLAALRDELGAAVYLTVYEDGEIQMLDVADSPRAPRLDMYTRLSDAGHATAVGKCTLRQLPEESWQDYLARHTMHDLTPRTVTRANELRRRLKSAGDNPVTFDNEEYALGNGCAAVPVFDGTRIGALGISFPVNKIGRVAESAELLLATGKRVSNALSLTI